MVADALVTAQRIGFVRPREVDGVRLWYADSHSFDPKRYNATDPLNALAQIRLYRWFVRLPESAEQMVPKDWLMGQLFPDTPLVKKERIGRILTMCLQYHPNFQRNAQKATEGRNVQYWRWSHPLDVVYGLEYLMLTWLPSYVEVNNSDDMQGELDVFAGQTPQDDLEFYRFLGENVR